MLFLKELWLFIKGYRLSHVVFYNGQNDGYRYYQNNEPIPSHAYYSRYKKMINEYSKMKRKVKLALRNKINILSKATFYEFFNSKLNLIGTKIYNFLYSPFTLFLTNKQVNILNKKDDLLSNIAFSKFKKKSSYLICETKKNAVIAANVTIFSWLQAYRLLKKYNIPVIFILQPITVYNTQKYNLDYIVNGVKQRIVDESNNYTIYYEQVRKKWNETCLEYGAYKFFIDLSEIFYNDTRPIFADNCHVGPQGNKRIAKDIVKKLKEYK